MDNHTNIVNEKDMVARHIGIFDKNGQEILRIKQYNNLTKEAVIYDVYDTKTNPTRYKVYLDEHGQPKTKNVILTDSYIRFIKQYKDK